MEPKRSGPTRSPHSRSTRGVATAFHGSRYLDIAAFRSERPSLLARFDTFGTRPSRESARLGALPSSCLLEVAQNREHAGARFLRCATRMRPAHVRRFDRGASPTIYLQGCGYEGDNFWWV